MGLALFGLKKNFFRPEKKEKARPFAQRKDFLRFRVGFCSKKTGNRRKKTSSPLPRSKNRGASPIGQWQSAGRLPLAIEPPALELQRGELAVVVGERGVEVRIGHRRIVVDGHEVDEAGRCERSDL